MNAFVIYVYNKGGEGLPLCSRINHGPELCLERDGGAVPMQRNRAFLAAHA